MHHAALRTLMPCCIKNKTLLIMRKTAFLLLTAFMLVPAAMFGDSYSKLWKQVDEAANKDLPKTQIQLLQTIADKAEPAATMAICLRQRRAWRRFGILSRPTRFLQGLPGLKTRPKHAASQTVLCRCLLCGTGQDIQLLPSILVRMPLSE